MCVLVFIAVPAKEYYEINLPPYLQHDLDAMKEGKYPYDCFWGKLYTKRNTAQKSFEKFIDIIEKKYYDVGVKRYFDPYDTRIAPHFMLPQS